MLEVSHISKTFNAGTVNEKRALSDLSLRLADGEFATIVGSNGAGKSTLFNAIAGVVYVDAGTITLDGRDITFLPSHKRSRRIGHLFQDPLKGTAPHMTIEENLAIAERRGQRHRARQLLTDSRRTEYRAWLAELGLGLEHRLGTSVALLSGGQRQALSLLMAVVSRPTLLLLDEHTAALDPRTAHRVMEATQHAVAERRLTTLMVTHNMNQAIGTGNRLIMMDAGRICYDVRGAEKSALTPEALVERFQIDNDRMLLKH